MTDPQLPQRQHKPVSCAECRRLKLRCDRVFPCSSCQKRGCAQLCPNGLMPSRKSNRPDKLADTRTEPLIARIRDLEHALATLQATYGNTPHPLLRKDLRDMTAQFAPAQPPVHPPDDLDQLSENLGTLSMTGYGKSRFFGTTGSAWSHIWNIKEVKDDIDDSYEAAANADLASLQLPPEIIQLISAFPFPRPTAAASQIGDWVVANLPPSLEAWSLCETFFENGAYIFVPLPRAMFIDEIFSFFYRSNQKQTVDIPRGHRLALLLMIFAIGDMLDLTKPAMPTGGKKYYYLARAALSLEPLYDQPTLTAVQSIMLMLIYLSMSDHKESAETVYVLSGLNLKLAFSLGLHRESLKFHMNQPITATQSTPTAHVPRSGEEELRRVIFHEIVHFETWQSLQFGRPSLLHLDHFDCGPPGSRPQRDSALETSHMKGQAWSYGFIRSCLIPVLNYAVAVKPPSYSDVLKLDAVVRAHTIPQHMQISFYEEDGPNSADVPSRAAVMLRFSSYSMREIALLYLHRPYFACAMTDYTGDPLGCPFERSVVASFGSACGIIAKIGLLFEKEPALSVRIWIFWSQLFVPCILCTIVARSPTCSLASTALIELDKLCDLLRRAKDGVRASTLLPHALKLRDKAHAAYELYYSTPGTVQPGTVDISAELSALAGKSRSSPPSSNSNSPASQPSTSSPAAMAPPEAQAPVAVISPAPPTVEQPLYPETDWSSFGDFAPSASSFPPESRTSPDLMAQQAYEYASLSNSHAPVTGVDTSDAWATDVHALFAQPADPASFPQDQAEYPPLELHPTWQHFMTQMGF